jgi:hypothetical protein
MITQFPNSPRYYVKKRDAVMWDIVDSKTGLYEMSCNCEVRAREYCHGFNYPSDSDIVRANSSVTSFSEECSKYGCD